MGITKSSSAIAKKLLKPLPHEAVVVHYVSWLARLISAIDFCSQSMMVNLTHAVFQNNQYWSSVNPQNEFKPI
jgi:hypothetical protein